MFIYNAKKQPVQLVALDTEVVTDRATRSLSVAVKGVDPERDPHNTSALVARAARAFFEIGAAPQKAGVTAEAPKGPPPVAFRESKTGLLHVVYREVVVRFRPGTTQKRRADMLKKHGFKVRRVNPFFSNQVIVFDPERRHNGEKLIEVANDWAETDEVEFAAPNFVSQYRRLALPKIRAEEWHLRNNGGGGAKKGEDVNVEAAWKITTGKKSIVVAVLDDGVDIDHPDLKSNVWKNPISSARDKFGRDFYLADDHPDHYNPRPKVFQFPYDQMDGNDIHGTCCAGVIVGAGKNNGSVGVAPGCRILAIKIFHGNSLVADERVANAMRYGGTIADILSCSWGGGGANPDVQQALEDLGTARNGRGAAVFCAAGNEFRSPVGFPASDSNAIAVSASTDRAALANYSNVGAEVSVAAPSSGGVRGIFTTDVSYPNRGFNIGVSSTGGTDGLYFNDFGGTSSATPLAAGVAALVLSVNPNLSRQALRDLLQNTADKIGGGYDANGHSDDFGYGRVNAGRAVQQASGANLPTKGPAKKGVKKGAKKGAKKAGQKAKTVAKKSVKKSATKAAKKGAKKGVKKPARKSSK
jgi:subtilisin family serine protease